MKAVVRAGPLLEREAEVKPLERLRVSPRDLLERSACRRFERCASRPRWLARSCVQSAPNPSRCAVVRGAIIFESSGDRWGIREPAAAHSCSRGHAGRVRLRDRVCPEGAVRWLARGWLLCWPSRTPPSLTTSYSDSSGPAVGVCWNRASAGSSFRGGKQGRGRDRQCSRRFGGRRCAPLARCETDVTNGAETSIRVGTRTRRSLDSAFVL
jgi:hypothetical protein